MEMTPMHRILKLEEVRKAMLRSAETQLGPIHPATRLDLNEFYNSCTGCLAATKQLQNQKEATITEGLWQEINQFSEQTELLRDEVVKLDMSYTGDGPLVKCLSRMMNKGDTVLREVRSQCNSKLLSTFGDDWMNETNAKYAKDLQIILNDIAPCIQFSRAQRASRIAATTTVTTASKAQAAPAATGKPSTNKPTESKPAATGGAPKVTVDASNVASTGSAKPILKGSINAPSPSIAGAADNEKHITFLSPHPDNENPEHVGVASIPHFKAHNYINLPQFTGVPEYTRPIFQQEMPPLHRTPDAESIYLAEKFPAP